MNTTTVDNTLLRRALAAVTTVDDPEIPGVSIVDLGLLETITATEDGHEQLGRERPEAYDSQSNGLTEVGVRSVRAHFRTLRACLQRRLGKMIPVGHPVSAWLIEHARTIHNAIVKGEDGLTAWIRSRGRPFGKRLVGFAEQVLYRLPGKGPQHDMEGNMAARWASGSFLGYARESNSYLIGTQGGVKTSRP